LNAPLCPFCRSKLPDLEDKRVCYSYDENLFDLNYFLNIDDDYQDNFNNIRRYNVNNLYHNHDSNINVINYNIENLTYNDSTSSRILRRQRNRICKLIQRKNDSDYNRNLNKVLNLSKQKKKHTLRNMINEDLDIFDIDI